MSVPPPREVPMGLPIHGAIQGAGVFHLWVVTFKGSGSTTLGTVAIRELRERKQCSAFAD